MERTDKVGGSVSASLLGKQGGNKVAMLVQTLGGDFVMDDAMPNVVVLDPGGAARDVRLPAEALGLFYVIINSADNPEALTVTDDGDTGTVVSIAQNEIGFVWCTGSAWYGVVGVA